MKSYQTYRIETEHNGLTVEGYLKQILRYSGRKIQKLTRKKGILLNKKPVILQKKVRTGDIIRILLLEDQSYGVEPQEGSIDILFEDSQLIILNKPPRMLVHPAGHTSGGTLANYLAHYFQEQGVVFTIRPLHRLDRDTSGCVVFAKDALSQTILERQMSTGDFQRTYVAIVNGRLEPQIGTLDFPIGKHPTLPNRRSVQEQGETAVTHYKVIQFLSELSLLELKLETGRTHQIRVHLAHIGNPVIGDTMYGKSCPMISRQALHAESVTFTHPRNRTQITVQAPLPADFSTIIGKLKRP
ncbi:MAG: Ribosomal large subunit pseudouridine synthase D [Candidatus Dichloromethanomonas elyunquensis]|nr:MAG: Ribosomal large subunit pseudouridine synthase D [Candidatus Dichloromethanomonas elyunquensis]